MTVPQEEHNLTSLTVDNFLGVLASTQPAPGGGSAAALTGAMAAALICMVARLTIGRAQYAPCSEEMLGVLDRAEALQRRLAVLADKDTTAYLSVMRSYSLPKATQTERAARAAEIQRTLRHAAEVPHEVATACGESIELAAMCAERGNRNAASDAAVAALLAHAGMRGAVLNVRTNLTCIGDESFNLAMEAHLGQVLAAGESALARALAAAGLGA
jgi:formiminotetrahydrofolate cyclodeaminase